MEGREKNFKSFTNLYELSKTLRFELKPVGETDELLKEQKVFQKDKQVLDNFFLYNLLSIPYIRFLLL